MNFEYQTIRLDIHEQIPEKNGLSLSNPHKAWMLHCMGQKVTNKNKCYQNLFIRANHHRQFHFLMSLSFIDLYKVILCLIIKIFFKKNIDKFIRIYLYFIRNKI